MTARALILAAGRGERLRPLTDITPKPLLPVRGKPFVEWHLLALARAGIKDVVINTAWREEQFPAMLGDGSRWGLTLHFSMEQTAYGGALDTAGGIATALPWLAPKGDESFWLISGDIFAPGFEFDDAQRRTFDAGTDLGHLWLVPNPPFNVNGDFALNGDRLSRHGERTWTYASLALMRPAMVAGIDAGTRAALGPSLSRAAAAGRLGGQAWHGEWHNVGTQPQWAALQTR